MKRVFEAVVSPMVAFDEDQLKNFLAKKINISPQAPEWSYRLLRRSIDARSKQVKVNLQVQISVGEALEENISYQKPTFSVENQPQAIVVGFGPAGMFAALRLIELGIKPIVLERGKDVRSRRRDLADLNKKHIVSSESNYCFGEGGAGTYSDGKLYTRSKKRGYIRRILEIFVSHGAKEDILIEAHPHIGTNKLPRIVSEIRKTILQAGGEIHFQTQLTDFIIKNQVLEGIVALDAEKKEKSFEGIGVILATGHSARDIFELLHKKNIDIEAKPFALGVRVEHPQILIDQVQYHCNERDPYLPASSYSLVTQVEHQSITKGVFSFCMCPGGFIVPAATAPGEIVTNGMSPSRRDGKFANSGIVVSVDAQEWKEYTGTLAALYFQQDIERKACHIAGHNQTAPAQRLLDFVNKKVSSSLPAVSYQPGLASIDMYEVLPEPVSKRLQEAFKVFGKKMKGYLTNEAQIVGVESRTSSPVKIPRDNITLEHPFLKKLFPCGEGAGYAGGIVSAAMDGERVAEQLVALYKKR